MRRPAHGCTSRGGAGVQGQVCPIRAQLGLLRRWWFSHLQTHQHSCNISPSGHQTRYSLRDGLFLPRSLLTVSPGVEHRVIDPRLAIQFSLLGLGSPAERLSVPLGSHILSHFLILACANRSSGRHSFSHHPIPSLLKQFILQNVTFPPECNLLLEALGVFSSITKLFSNSRPTPTGCPTNLTQC